MLQKRKSGILLHISSLPSGYGIGDLGPEAYRFADFLYKAGQSLWQMLPFNPTKKENCNSPYSSSSAFAGNPLFISPDLLYKDGLLKKADIGGIPALPDNKVDYPATAKVKEGLLEKAFANFLKIKGTDYNYRIFCEENSYWLDDYAMFEAFTCHFEGKPWDAWPAKLRNRNKDTLLKLRQKLDSEIEKYRFYQYLFFRQWQKLKEYCNQRKIQIIGDLPLYVNYNSADVWSHPGLFKLNKRKKPIYAAGVPPDYFSEDGQLWGNPIYHWENLKKEDYSWWIKRIAHNLKLYDRIRLDHFKGFVAYWQVPAKENTARKGRWIKGPGYDLFYAFIDHFPGLPLIAEDLGEIDADVRELKNYFKLPGMRILQFGFGGDSSPYKPHNYDFNSIAYTGTHDNNTMMGWLFEGVKSKKRSLKKIGKDQKRALEYIGLKAVKAEDIHMSFIRILMMSRAAFVIFPMQDILGLDEKARMNIPGVATDNWEWRLEKKQATPLLSKKLKELTEIYDRV